MTSRNSAVIFWLAHEMLGLRAASNTSSKAASKVATKAAATAPAPPAPEATETPKKAAKTTKPAKPTEPKVKAPPKLFPVSPTLRNFLGGVAEISRPDTVKQLWVYIREHQLQDPADKKKINCDEKLKTVLGKDRVNFLEIPALISPHFPKKEVKKS
ncbi:unnamed protein product [Calypogeia fissa]